MDAQSRALISPAATRAGSDHRGGFTQRYLHKLVATFSGCLTVVSSRYANVLSLRTGWGIHRSYDRRAVARLLHVSVAREGQIERRAVAALGQAGKQAGCSRAEQANRAALFLAPGELSLLAQPYPRAFIGSTVATPHTSVKGIRRSRHGRPHPSVSRASASIQGPIPNLAHPGTSSFPWLLIALALVAATALASPLARRRMAHPREAGAGIPNRRSARRAGVVRGVPRAPAAHAEPAAPTAHPEPAAPTAHPESAAPVAHPESAQPAAESEAAAALGAGAAAAGAAEVASEREQGRPDGSPAEHVGLGAQLERQGDIEGALAAYRHADAAGDASGATNLGVLLEQRGDLDGALAAYRRADQRGDANGSFNLGCLLAERGDLSGAAAALRRADNRGDPAGASNLGVLLEQQGDLNGALAAYRRADQRGDANGSFNLGLLLANHDDPSGAQSAYRRAIEHGDPEVKERARSALAELRDNGGRQPSNGDSSR